MAAGILPTPAATILLFLLLTLTLTLAFGETHTFSRRLSPSKLGLKKEKLTHFRVFWHDVVSGPNATAVIVASAPAVPSNRSSTSSSTGFGLVAMIDDALTVGPKRSSKLVGRAQGLYAQASQEELGLLMAMNFVFVEGKYNGSTISILGRNKVFSQVREMPIIGGSGLFRFARGYVHASTHSLDLKTGDAVVEYNVYVMHY